MNEIYLSIAMFLVFYGLAVAYLRYDGQTKSVQWGGGFVAAAALWAFIMYKIMYPDPTKPAAAAKPSWRTELTDGYVACISEPLFDEMMQAISKKDQMQINYLLANGCFLTKNGVRFSVLDVSFGGTAKIRAYLNAEESAVLWINTKAIRQQQ